MWRSCFALLSYSARNQTLLAHTLDRPACFSEKWGEIKDRWKSHRSWITDIWVLVHRPHTTRNQRWTNWWLYVIVRWIIISDLVVWFRNIFIESWRLLFYWFNICVRIVDDIRLFSRAPPRDILCHTIFSCTSHYDYYIAYLRIELFNIVWHRRRVNWHERSYSKLTFNVLIFDFYLIVKIAVWLIFIICQRVEREQEN